MSSRLLQYFGHAHLPGPLRETASHCAILAEYIDKHLPESPEKTVGLRKLLEAKDCFVRASLCSGVTKGSR